MAALVITPDDLAPFADIPFAKAEAMIQDVMASASRIAPCITSDGFTQEAAAKAVLRRVILRWHRASGDRVTFTESTGAALDTIDAGRLFLPGEISDLQTMCSDGAPSGAFSIETIPTNGIVHADICTLNFGGLYCSCGAVLTGMYPLYEV